VLHVLIPALQGHYLIEAFADEGKTTGLRDAICRGLVPKDQAEVSIYIYIFIHKIINIVID